MDDLGAAAAAAAGAAAAAAAAVVVVYVELLMAEADERKSRSRMGNVFFLDLLAPNVLAPNERDM